MSTLRAPVTNLVLLVTICLIWAFEASTTSLHPVYSWQGEQVTTEQAILCKTYVACLLLVLNTCHWGSGE
jgi:hypothetical protein